MTAGSKPRRAFLARAVGLAGASALPLSALAQGAAVLQRPIPRATERLPCVGLGTANVFNVGNDEEITILALAQRIKALTGGRSAIRTVPYGEAYTAGFEDMQRRVPDLSKVHKLIGYKPTRGLDQVLADVLAAQAGPDGGRALVTES